MSGAQLIIHVLFVCFFFSTVELSGRGLLLSVNTLGPGLLLEGVTPPLRGLPLGRFISAKAPPRSALCISSLHLLLLPSPQRMVTHNPAFP